MDTVLQIALLTMLVWVVVEIRRLVVTFKVLTQSVDHLRLTSRARISTTSMQSGEVTDEQKLTRMGRSTYGKRVVVGGDEESPLHTNLSRTVVTHDDD